MSKIEKRKIAASVKRSWGNAKTAKARSARHAVRVGRTEYGSVRQAFRELKLNDGAHQRFRKQLFAEGRARFEGHTFTVVKS